MKKTIALIIALVLAMTLMTGCAYLPVTGLTSLYGANSSTAPAATALPAAGTVDYSTIKTNGIDLTGIAPTESAPAATEVPTAGVDYSIVGSYSSDVLAGLLGDNGETTGTVSDTVTISRAEYERYQQFSMLFSIMDTVHDDYYQDVDDTVLIQGAAAGMLDAIGDPYTFYYTPEAYAEMWEDDEGEYAGIGIQISGNYSTGICTVSRVFTGTPAEAAGIRKGDILYRVGDDLYVTADNLDEAVSIMRGTPGTTVEVTFLRKGEEMTYTLERARVNQNWVEYGMLTDDVGLIILYQFAGDSSEKFIAAADELISKGAKGIIIDLRDNPGGWVSDAVNICDYFLDSGVVCTAQYKGGYNYTYRTYNGKQDVELVILINENSASSSEILTGCLHDRTDCTVVGKTSYGKGIIQSVLSIGNDGSGMQLTVAEYVTPNEHHIHGIGITPDVEVDLAEDDTGMHEFGDLSDAQLARALEVMNQKLGK